MCVRLMAERDARQLTYTMAVSRWKLRIATSDNREYMGLRARADEAKIDLDLVDAEIAQHQKHHVPGYN